jgi:hypothetical protein
MRIAKTILHECIHAYLAIKGKYPDAGQKPIPGIENMTFEEVLKATRPGKDVQHDFMYNNMVPTMQKVLGEIRDLVTFPAGRSAVEELNMSGNSTTNIPWNWNEYYKFLSFSGLNEASYFIKNYPDNSNAKIFYNDYNLYGHNYLRD